MNTRTLPLVLALAVALSACATVPSASEFAATRIEFPSHAGGRSVVDGRMSFRQTFCSILQRDGLAASDDVHCEQWLWKLSDEPSAPDRGGREVSAGQLRLRWFLVPGALNDCFGEDGRPYRAGVERLAGEGGQIQTIATSGRSGSSYNASLIADALRQANLHPSDRVALLGYSKGAVDILEFLSGFPELAANVDVVVSVAGPITGSPLAQRAEWTWRHFFSGALPGRCAPGDGKLVESLLPGTRTKWLETHRLPGHVRFFSIGAFTTSEHLARGLREPWRLLARTDRRNDGQVLIGDSVIPGSTLLGFVNADHWGLALRIERELPHLAGRTDPQPYPQEQLLEAIVRFAESESSSGSAASSP